MRLNDRLLQSLLRVLFLGVLEWLLNGLCRGLSCFLSALCGSFACVLRATGGCLRRIFSPFGCRVSHPLATLANCPASFLAKYTLPCSPAIGPQPQTIPFLKVKSGIFTAEVSRQQRSLGNVITKRYL